MASFKRALLAAATVACAAAAGAGSESAVGGGLRRKLNFWDPVTPTPSPTPTTFYQLNVTAPPVGSDSAIFGSFGITPSSGVVYTDYKALIYIGTNTSDSSGIPKFWGPKPGNNAYWRLDDYGDFTASDWKSDSADLVSPFIVTIIVRIGTPIPAANGIKLDQLIALFNPSSLLTYKVTIRDVPFTCVIDKIPTLGSLGPIVGHCDNLPDFVDKYSLAVYVRNSQGKLFGSKPTFGSSFSLEVDGSFKIFNWPSHPNDIHVPCIVVVLLPAGYRPKDVNGQNSLEQSMISYTFWATEICRVVSYSPSPSPTPTRTQTPTRTPTRTSTPSNSPTPSNTRTRTPTPTSTQSAGFTPSSTPTPSVTPSVTPSRTPSPTPSVTPGRGAALVNVVVPPIGSTNSITGGVDRLPGENGMWAVCLYVQSQVNGQWYGPKPKYVDPNNGGFSCVAVDERGNFTISNWANDPLDATVDAMGLFVVPFGARPLPVATGQTVLHTKLYDWSITYGIFIRPRVTTIEAVVPSLGSAGPIYGRINNAVGPSNSYGVCVYVFTQNGGWYGPKPQQGAVYGLAADYSFTISGWASGFGDSGVPIIALFLVPSTFVPPQANGLPTLPEALLKLRIDAQQYSRTV